MSATAVVTVEAPTHDLDGTPASAPRTSHGLGAWLKQVACWLVILGVLAMLAAAVVTPRIGGATPYTVLTGSMAPNYSPGTLVVVKPADPSEIAIGDVITFQLESGKATVVTHRVIGVRPGADGKPEFITKGDANDVPDADPVRSVQVRGKLWYAVPYLGRVNTLLSGDQRQLAVYAFAGALVLYAGIMFASGARSRRRR